MVCLVPGPSHDISTPPSGLRRKGALVADGEVERIMARVDLDGNNTLDFKVGG